MILYNEDNTYLAR